MRYVFVRFWAALTHCMLFLLLSPDRGLRNLCGNCWTSVGKTSLLNCGFPSFPSSIWSSCFTFHRAIAAGHLSVCGRWGNKKSLVTRCASPGHKWHWVHWSDFCRTRGCRFTERAPWPCGGFGRWLQFAGQMGWVGFSQICQIWSASKQGSRSRCVGLMVSMWLLGQCSWPFMDLSWSFQSRAVLLWRGSARWWLSARHAENGSAGTRWCWTSLVAGWSLGWAWRIWDTRGCWNIWNSISWSGKPFQHWDDSLTTFPSKSTWSPDLCGWWWLEWDAGIGSATPEDWLAAPDFEIWWPDRLQLGNFPKSEWRF